MITVICVGCTSAEAAPPLRGARLGMSARDVRARFEPPTEGEWKSETDPEPKLHFAAPDGSIREATFEFHSGMLVAATVRLEPRDPAANGPPVVVTPSAITARTVRGPLVEVRVIARDCPYHQDEIRTLLALSP